MAREDRRGRKYTEQRDIINKEKIERLWQREQRITKGIIIKTKIVFLMWDTKWYVNMF